MALTAEQLTNNLSQAALISSEKEWKLVEKRPIVSDQAIQQEIGLGRSKCPLCRGSRTLDLLCEGVTTGLKITQAVRCSCMFYTAYWGEFLTKVPVHDQFVKLKTLVPTSKNIALSKERQAKAIEILKNNPDKSYIFLGPAQTCKTTFSLALYQDALHRRALEIVRGGPVVNSIWRISARDLCQEFHFYETNREMTDVDGQKIMANPPSITPKKIKLAASMGVKPRLFLEEIDKLNLTDFRLNTLFEVIDAIYSNNGQIVINSNYSAQELKNFLQRDSKQGEVFFRRLIDDGNGAVLDFYPA